VPDLGDSQLVFLGLSAFFGGLIFGVLGFAYGVIASLFLHHAYSPSEVVFLVVAGALTLNLFLLPRLWREISWRQSLPYVLGGLGGIPFGFLLLVYLPGPVIKMAVAGLIVAYCSFAWWMQSANRPDLPAYAHSKPASFSVGLAGGIVGGVSGLGPLIPSLWFGLLRLNKHSQRGLSQPFGILIQSVMTALLLGSGRVSAEALMSLLIALPLLGLSVYLGFRVFQAMAVERFRQAVVIAAMAGASVLFIRQMLVLG
jgi:uncharacterized membrane protein YfcA